MLEVGNNLTDFFYLNKWNEPSVYPSSGSLISIERNVPLLAPLYTSFETNFFPPAPSEFMRRNYWIAPFAAVLYLVFVWLGPKYMQNRKPYNLIKPLRLWNLLLTVFSVMGSLRLVPHDIYYIYKVGFLQSLCCPPVYSHGTGSAGLWTCLFVISKVNVICDV